MTDRITYYPPLETPSDIQMATLYVSNELNCCPEFHSVTREGFIEAWAQEELRVIAAKVWDKVRGWTL